MSATWKTGLFDCCAEPGGAGLCFKTYCCHCLTFGEINEFAGGPGGYVGGCLCPCWFSLCMCRNGPVIAAKAGFQADGCTSCLTASFCGACYACQVRREISILQGQGPPRQMQMGMPQQYAMPQQQPVYCAPPQQGYAPVPQAQPVTINVQAH